MLSLQTNCHKRKHTTKRSYICFPTEICQKRTSGILLATWITIHKPISLAPWCYIHCVVSRNACCKTRWYVNINLTHPNISLNVLTLKKGSLWPAPPLCGFSKNLSSKERVKSCYKLDLFRKFHWNSSSRSEDMMTFSINISYFHQFSSMLWIFWHFLVTKRLIFPFQNFLLVI